MGKRSHTLKSLGSLLGLMVMITLTGGSAIAQCTPTTFNYTGAVQTYLVPAGVTSIAVDLSGGEGGGYLNGTNSGGNGGRVTAILAVTPGQVLNIYVGGAGTTAGTAGYNGGGSGSSGGGGGGGASDIRVGGTALANRIIVAGGGGGAGGTTVLGGAGGGTTGGTGGEVGGSGGGTGGTQSGGGSAGAGGSNGTLGVGGSYIAGGGGGYYGGGSDGNVGGGGGGGSSYTNSTYATSVVNTQGYNGSTSSSAANGVVIITLGAPTVPAVSASATLICNGDGTTLSITSGSLNGAANWQWYVESCGGDHVGTGSNVTFHPSGNTIYYARGEGGCITTPGSCGASVTVTVQALPIGLSPQKVCVGSSVEYDPGNETGGSGTWSSSNTAVASVNSSGIVTGGAVPGTASITYVYTNSACGTGTVSAPVTVNAFPTVTLASSQPATCVGTTVTINPTVSGVTSPTYSWSVPAGDGTFSNTAALTTNFTPAVAGAMSLTLNVTAGGCTTTKSTTVNAAGIVSVTGSAACGTNSQNLHATGTTTPPSTVNWYSNATGGTSLITGNAYTPSLASSPSAPVTYTYYVSAVSSSGCASSPRVAVVATVNPIPSVAATDPSQCGSGIMNFPLTESVAGVIYWFSTPSTVTQTAGGSYMSATGTPITTGITVSGLTSTLSQSETSVPDVVETATNYYIAVGTAGNCYISNSISGTVYPMPDLQTFTASANAYCAGGSGVDLMLSSQTFDDYGLYYNGSEINSALGDGSGDPLDFGLQTGAGSYVVIATNIYTCSDTMPVPQTVSINPVPSTSVTSTNTSCNTANGDPVHEYSDGTTTATTTGGTAGYTYLWSDPAAQTTSMASGLPIGTYSVTVTDVNGCTATGSTTVSQPDPMTVALTPVNVSCNTGNGGNSSNGTITAVASGGAYGFGYLWNDPATQTSSEAIGLAPGGYTVTVTDANSCTATGSSTVGQPDLLTVSATSTPVNCNTANGGIHNNGTISTTTTGGSGSNEYTYYSSTITDGGYPEFGSDPTAFPASTYTVTVTDAHSCTATTVVAVDQPDPLSVSLTPTNITCNNSNGGTHDDGSISTSVTGGTPSYGYSWFDGISTPNHTGLTAVATYSVIVTDASGCTTTGSATVGQPDAFSASITSNNDPLTCNVPHATLTASGGATYSWNTAPPTSGSTLLVSDGSTYMVTATNSAGCTATSSYAEGLDQTPPVVDAMAFPGDFCSASVGLGKDINIFVGDANTTYTLLLNGVPAPGIPTVDVPYHGWIFDGADVEFGLQNSVGVYTIVASDDYSGCTSTMSGNITIYQSPDPMTGSSAVCVGSTITVADATTGGTFSVSESDAAYATVDPVLGVVTGISAGTATVTYTVPSGCYMTYPVAVNGLPTATATITQALCHGGLASVLVTATGGTGADTYTGTGTFSLADGASSTYTVSDANSCSSTSNSVTAGSPSQVVATATITQALCHGGAASVLVTATGGTGSYTGTGTFSLPDGTSSTYIVTDGHSCPATSNSVSANSPSQVVATATVTQALCHGGAASVLVTATGGTGSYTGTGTFSLPDGTSSTYNVTDGHSCPATSNSVAASSPSQVVATATITQALCHGGAASVLVTATGGTGAYTGTGTFSLPDGTSSTYNVTDGHSCPATSNSVAASSPSQVVATATITQALCHGGAASVLVTATGGTGAYTGTGTFSLADGTSSTYTVHDGHSCSATSNSVTASSPAAIAVSISSSGNLTCTATSATLTASGATTYTWSGSSSTSSTRTVTAAGTYTVTGTTAGCSATATYTETLTTTPLATPTVTVVNNCGSSTLTAAGIVSGATVTWSPSGSGNPLTVTTSGSYTATQSLSGCTSSASAAVAAAPGSGLTLTPTITNVSCHGGSNGSISVVASGGSGSYTYSWAPCGGSTNSITGKTAGTYTVTVTNGECHATGVYTITQPSAALAVSGTVTNETCNGGDNGKITTTVTGGTPAYSYLWSPGGATTSSLSGKTAGTYNVTVTDAHGCTTSGSYTITQPGAITCSINVTPSTTCYTGGVPTNFYLGYGPQSATCNASCSASGCTYSWSGSSGTSCLSNSHISNPVYNCSAAGSYTYSCTATNSSGCSTTQTVHVCVVDCRDHSHTGNILVCRGSGCSPTTVSCESSSVPTYICPSLCPANYLGGVGSGCSETGGREAGENSAVINELTVNAYPNPFNSELNVKIQSNLTDNVDVTVYDVTGRTMEAKKAQSSESVITVGQNLTPGVYFIEVNQAGAVRKVKVVKY